MTSDSANCGADFQQLSCSLTSDEGRGNNAHLCTHSSAVASDKEKHAVMSNGEHVHVEINFPVAPEFPSRKATSQEKWQQMFNQLLNYKDEHSGSCLVPNRYKKNPQLGSWVSTQRRQYKQYKVGDMSPMTAERISALEDAGFVWATRDPRHVTWKIRYEELRQYRDTIGDCLVPIGYKKNKQLSNWVSTQRQEMKLLREGRPSRLTKDRITLLHNLDFVWEVVQGPRL